MPGWPARPAEPSSSPAPGARLDVQPLRVALAPRRSRCGSAPARPGPGPFGFGLQRDLLACGWASGTSKAGFWSPRRHGPVVRRPCRCCPPICGCSSLARRALARLGRRPLRHGVAVERASAPWPASPCPPCCRARPGTSRPAPSARCPWPRPPPGPRVLLVLLLLLLLLGRGDARSPAAWRALDGPRFFAHWSGGERRAWTRRWAAGSRLSPPGRFTCECENSSSSPTNATWPSSASTKASEGPSRPPPACACACLVPVCRVATS